LKKKKTLTQSQSALDKKKRMTVVKYVLTFVFITGFILTVMEVKIYRNTLINWYYPTSIFLISGIVMIPITSNFLRKYYDITSLAYRLLYNAAVFGGLTTYSLMASNYYFPKQRERTIRTEIIKTSTLGGRNRTQYAEVKIDGQIKQLMFPRKFKIDDYKFVDLVIKNGLLGIDVIYTKELVNDSQ
jgi:hypothetical protein